MDQIDCQKESSDKSDFEFGEDRNPILGAVAPYRCVLLMISLSLRGSLNKEWY